MIDLNDAQTQVSGAFALRGLGLCSICSCRRRHRGREPREKQALRGKETTKQRVATVGSSADNSRLGAVRVVQLQSCLPPCSRF